VQSNQHIYVRKLLYELRRADHSIVVRDRDGSISGATLLGLIFRYAHVLQGLGIKRGKLLAMFAPNRPDAIAIRYAAHLLGAATAYLSMPPTTAQRRALIEQMAPDLLVVFPESVHCIEEAGAVSFVTVGTSEIGSKGRLDLLAASASADPVEVLAEANDLGVIASSGGSTGVPKGSCRSFAAYSAMVDAPSSPNRIQLINGPLAYLSQVLVDVTLLGRGQVVFRDAYDAADTLATVERERITDLFLVEPQLFELMDHRGVDARDLSSLRSITHIGVSAPNCLRQRARERFGPIMRHVYGASEMGVVSVLAPGEHDPSQPEVFGSAGHIQPGVEIRFRRADGRLAGPGETGTIEVRSPAVAQGYRNNPGLTERSFQQGWYHTGDLGRLDRDGFLHILGRAVDALEVGGVRVMPTEIEEALCRHPSIRYAVAVRDAEANLTIAVVTPWPGASIDAATCRRTVMLRFGAAVAASLIVIPVERTPLTEQGKPDRAAIVRLARRDALDAESRRIQSR
jgi:fatty-acyl-CoA synthase